MIVRNEEQHLARCLASVRGVVDEIVIVDTGSTDRTPVIAREFGAAVIASPWQDDFSQARNVALDHARGRWILVLDADEMLVPETLPTFRTLLAQATPATGAPNRAFHLVVRNCAENSKIGQTASIIRLFPNRPDIRFEWRIHEQVATSLLRARVPIGTSGVTILHTGYSDPATNQRKQRRNRELLLRQIAHDREVTPLTHFLLAGCYLDLSEFDAALARYTEARTLAANDPEIFRGATVRMISCLLALGRHAEALVLMPPQFDESWHPEMVFDRAVVARALENEEAARPHYERVFQCPDRPQLPACNVAALKIEALKFLGSYWHARGRGALAVQLLRRAVALNAEGRDFSPADLAALYRIH